jgi:hypothetical protein
MRYSRPVWTQALPGSIPAPGGSVPADSDKILDTVNAYISIARKLLSTCLLRKQIPQQQHHYQSYD